MAQLAEGIGDVLSAVKVTPFAGGFPPVNWEYCQGQVLQIEANMALFSLLGTQFGGDGVTTFGLPSLTPLTPAGAGAAPINYIICVNGIYPQRHDQ